MRRGFTLIELLVASGVFVIGFVAVFGLFLAGIRFRKLADDTARAAMAASSLIEEIRIDAGREGAGAPFAPTAYIGDGFVTVKSPNELVDKDPANCSLYAYASQPGIWYRVLRCTDLLGNDEATATTLRLRLLVLPWPSAEDPNTFTIEDMRRRLRLRPEDPTGAAWTVDTLVEELRRRGIAFTTDAAIVRHPSWLTP